MAAAPNRPRAPGAGTGVPPEEPPDEPPEVLVEPPEVLVLVEVLELELELLLLDELLWPQLGVCLWPQLKKVACAGAETASALKARAAAVAVVLIFISFPPWVKIVRLK